MARTGSPAGEGPRTGPCPEGESAARRAGGASHSGTGQATRHLGGRANRLYRPRRRKSSASAPASTATSKAMKAWKSLVGAPPMIQATGRAKQ